MSQDEHDVSKEDEEYGDRMSEWAENLTEKELEAIFESATVHRGEEASGLPLLIAALGSREAVDKAMGRPSLDPTAPKGTRSPVRQVRLPRDLDARLKERAAAEHRRPSDVVREALSEYLDRHSA